MNLLLDLDGTLTDPRTGITRCIQHALRKMGREAPEEAALLQYIGPPLQASFREMLGEGADAALAVAAYRERFATVGMFENSVYPGIPDALSQLKEQGARLFVATSKPRVFAQRILEHFELVGFFDHVHGSELDGRLTVKGDLIAHILEQSRLERTRTVMIGDRLHDIEGAVANGVQPIGVLWGYGSREELVAAGAKVLLESPSDLAECLQWVEG